MPPLVALLKRFKWLVGSILIGGVQDLLARVLTELNAASQGTEAVPAIQAEGPLPVEEWCPAPGVQVKQAISTRRAEREARYQQAENFHHQGLTFKQITRRMMISERTVRHWRKLGVAPDTRPRRKYASAFNPYSPYVLTRWENGERNGTHIWREIAAQDYPGSHGLSIVF